MSKPLSKARQYLMHSSKSLGLSGLAFVITMGLLAGCAGMGKEECMAIDWRTVGYEDGVRGRTGDHIATYRKACGKYGVRADLDLYQQGRNQGLREFCQPVNGYRLGTGGSSYYGVCPVELERPFRAAFDSGHQLYVLTSRISNAEAELNARRVELDNLEHGILDNSVQAVSPNNSTDGRAHSVLDVAQQAERAGRIKSEIRRLNEDIARYQQDLDDYRAGHPPVT